MAVKEPFGGLVWQICDAIPDVGACLGHLDPRHDTAGTKPGFRAIGGFTTIFRVMPFASVAADAAIIEVGENLLCPDFVGTESDHLMDRTLFASGDGFAADVMTIALYGERWISPVYADAADQAAQMSSRLLAVRRLPRAQYAQNAMASGRVICPDR
jgi:hypothetical protein